MREERVGYVLIGPFGEFMLMHLFELSLLRLFQNYDIDFI